MKKSLLIATIVPENETASPSGRSHKIATQGKLLKKNGWDQIVGSVSRGYCLPVGTAHCLRLAYRHNVDVVHSISEPIHLHVAGFIVSTALDIPWVAHARDSMVTNKTSLTTDSIEHRARKKLEQFVVTHADKVLWDDKGGLLPEGYFETTYPNIRNSKFIKLPPIGFVRDQFETAPIEERAKPTITFAGRFYESLEPYEFLDGFKRYVNRTDDQTVRFHVYGGWEQPYQEYCEEQNIAEFVEPHDWISHEELIPKLKGSDVLLHIGGNNPEHEDHLGSKLYDYIGAQSPILVIGDPTFEAATVVEEHGLGIAVQGDKPGEVADGLVELLNGKFNFNPDPTVYDGFSRENRIEALATVFDDVA